MPTSNERKMLSSNEALKELKTDNSLWAMFHKGLKIKFRRAFIIRFLGTYFGPPFIELPFQPNHFNPHIFAKSFGFSALCVK